MRAMASRPGNNERLEARKRSTGVRSSERLRDAISAHLPNVSSCVRTAVERTQQLLQQAEYLDAAMDGVAAWVNTRNVSVAWRRKTLAQFQAAHDHALSCQSEVLQSWGVLRSPLDVVKLEEFERRLDLLQQALVHLTLAMDDGKTKLRDREELSACRCIQLWTRQHLAKRGFYTQELKLSRHHRGLIPGLFDSIGGTSKLITHRQARRSTLEYPTSDANWDSFASPRRERHGR